VRVTIAAVGRMKSGPEQELLARYVDRAGKAGRQIGITAVAVRETVESRRPGAQSRKDEEAVALGAMLDPASYAVLLDERGDDLDSAAFAGMLRASLEAGVPETAFLIGGPDGHGDGLRARAKRSIRFGKLTWPHQIVRVLLAEQLYRSVTILTGHPYHRD